MCDECLSIWCDPKNLDKEIDYPYMDVENPSWPDLLYDVLIEEVGCSLNETRDATEEEIKKYGWAKYIGKKPNL